MKGNKWDEKKGNNKNTLVHVYRILHFTLCSDVKNFSLTLKNKI